MSEFRQSNFGTHQNPALDPQHEYDLPYRVAPNMSRFDFTKDLGLPEDTVGLTTPWDKREKIDKGVVVNHGPDGFKIQRYSFNDIPVTPIVVGTTLKIIHSIYPIAAVGANWLDGSGDPTDTLVVLINETGQVITITSCGLLDPRSGGFIQILNLPIELNTLTLISYESNGSASGFNSQLNIFTYDKWIL